MAKVHPQTFPCSSSSCSSPSMEITSRREVYTLWMRSLVFHGNGCTVYDSNGRIAYRVDNYACKCSDEVFFMDHSGKVLFKILRKRFRVFGVWEGYRCTDSGLEEKKPWFRVRKARRFLWRDRSGETTAWVGRGKEYQIGGRARKSECRIMDMAGELVAEVKRKQTASGVVLGEDVLSLVVEPSVNHLLVMGLVVVCGLINHSL
ncbi:protein LURP-one-related 11-like [Phoenix dactylifera]|uniref:Protein LURP-one-related 11-like n=1 Tax=Phoenix dactylifera TaxID=42345 RepID=A0A8B7MUV4_PHODC|nr:protein LURP-one-related 11-like [Phoenix dactylifera]